MKPIMSNVVYCENCRMLWQLERSDSKKIYGYLYQRIKCPSCGHEIAL